MSVNLHELPCHPDGETMQAFIERLFSCSGMRGMIELSWTSKREPHRLERAKLFDLSDTDLIAEEAVAINAIPNCNLYISAGLRKPEAAPFARATDNDVLACVALWADFDQPGALDAAIVKVEAAGFRPTMVTFTGRHPHTRGQMWWVLDEPHDDLALHAKLVRQLALWLGGDTKVFNPSRVMRFPGSVAWPMKAGRQLEMTGFYEAETRSDPYFLEEAQRKIEALAPAPDQRPTAQLFDFNNAAPTHDVEALIQQSAKPGQWHNAMVIATAHLLGRGTPPDVILDMLAPRVTLAGYSEVQTRNELRVMIRGGVAKGYLRDNVSDDVGSGAGSPASAAAPAQGAAANPFMTIRELGALPPVEWMIRDFLPSQGMSALFAPPGAFKSFLALDMALSVAYGVPWHGFDVRQRKALYIVAEGRGGFYRRIRAWQEARVRGADTDQFMLLPQPVNFLEPANVAALIEAIDTYLGGVGFIVIDTLARSFGGGDENSTKDMNAYVAGADALVQMGAHVMHVHHKGKDSSKGERGSSAFRGALDTALEIDRLPGDEVVTLFSRKQKDAEEAKPVRLRFARVEATHPDTGEIMGSRVATLAGDDAPETPLAGGAGVSKLGRDLLALMASGIHSVSVMAAQLAVDKSSVSRGLRRLSERQLARRDENGFWFANEERTVNGRSTEKELVNQEDED